MRVNDRFQIEDAAFAESLWESTALRELVMTGRIEGEEEEDEANARKKVLDLWGGEPLGLNSNIRVYRYSNGQFFAQHCEFLLLLLLHPFHCLIFETDDDSNTLTFTNKRTATPVPARTTWTLLIYLSACDGGETVFYPEPTRWNRNPAPVSVAPEMGMALLHRHGDQCLLHEGKEVLRGEKWVLRSDLVVGR